MIFTQICFSSSFMCVLSFVCYYLLFVFLYCFSIIPTVATFRKGVRAVQMVGRASMYYSKFVCKVQSDRWNNVSLDSNVHLSHIKTHPTGSAHFVRWARPFISTMNWRAHSSTSSALLHPSVELCINLKKKMNLVGFYFLLYRFHVINLFSLFSF